MRHTAGYGITLSGTVAVQKPHRFRGLVTRRKLKLFSSYSCVDHDMVHDEVSDALTTVKCCLGRPNMVAVAATSVKTSTRQPKQIRSQPTSIAT